MRFNNDYGLLRFWAEAEMPVADSGYFRRYLSEMRTDLVIMFKYGWCGGEYCQCDFASWSRLFLSVARVWSPSTITRQILKWIVLCSASNIDVHFVTGEMQGGDRRD